MEKDENESRENYLALYVQKQEQMLLDFIRKSIDADIRATALKAALNDMTLKYEESQKQVEIQNDMMSQAAKGLETTTIEKKHLEEKEKDLLNRLKETQDNYENRIKDLQNNYDNRIKTIEEERHKVNNELQKTNDEYSDFKKKNEEIFREFERQKEEMNSLFKENQEISKKLEKYEPKEKIVINKKDKKMAILPTDEF